MVVVLALNPNIQEQRGRQISLLEASLVHRVTSPTVKATQRNPFPIPLFSFQIKNVYAKTLKIEKLHIMLPFGYKCDYKFAVCIPRVMFL